MDENNPSKIDILIDKVFRNVYDVGLIIFIRRKTDEIFRELARIILPHIIKIDEKKVLFLNTTGNYDCNPKAICQEMIDQNIDANIVWATRKKTLRGSEFFPDGITYTIRDTYDGYKQLCSAKVIVDNSVAAAWTGYRKKKGQYLIETWHGSIGIKKFGRDCNADPHWLKVAEKQGKMTDFIISNSDFEDDIYREDFWKETEIWKFGHARNDILFTTDADKIATIREKIFSIYEIPEGVRLCMYAPTFREDGDLSPYKLDYDKLREVLKERFGGEWIVLTRFHRNTNKVLKNSRLRLPEGCINVTSYDDIQELMLIIDAGITDYSSWICEYMLRRKPGFIFATDVDNFTATNRTFFIPLDEYPFPMANNENDLFKNILEFDKKKYVDDCNQFLKEKGSVDDGHASERIVAEIKKLINA